ncbi:MAG: hypothetical protein AAF211_28715 [Myxococcota bacterium]
MPVGTVSPPASHSQVFGNVGFDYVFAEQEILLELQDQMNLMGLGVVPLRGDLAGAGSDTVRISDLGDVGYSLPFQELSSETDTVTPSPFQLGYETITIGQFGLSHSETYKFQVLNREPGISLDSLKARVPQSWARTFRDRVTPAGSGIVTAVGSSSTSLDVDDHLDLATAYKVNLGNRRPVAMIDGTQFDQLSRAYRTEPAFTNSAAEFAEVLGLVTDSDGRISQIRPNFGGMGIDLAITDSIVQSGGARQGFAFPPGGIGWAVANTSPIRPANNNGAIYVPAMGLFIEELTEGGKQTKRQYRATTLFGVALGSERVFTLRRFISQV